jgi:hypothetical protein
VTRVQRTNAGVAAEGAPARPTRKRGARGHGRGRRDDRASEEQVQAEIDGVASRRHREYGKREPNRWTTAELARELNGDEDRLFHNDGGLYGKKRNPS